MPSPVLSGLRLRVVADKSEGERLVRYIARNVQVDEDGTALVDPDSMERILFNPATPEIEHEPWPRLGIQIEGDPPRQCRISIRLVNRGRVEGWLELEGVEVVHRPGGPPTDLWRTTHSFEHAQAVVVKTLDGDVRYRVMRQPDKYVDRSVDSNYGRAYMAGKRESYESMTAEELRLELISLDIDLPASAPKKDLVEALLDHDRDEWAGSNSDEAKVTDEIYAAGETKVDRFYDLELER